MADYTDPATATRFVTPETPDESMMFPGMAVYVHTHHPGETEDLHTHDEHHVLVMRSGRMRWTVEGQAVLTGPGDVVVVPAGADHSFEVVGDEPVKLLCIESPNPEADRAPTQ